jgi:hypothetical protein
MMKGVEGVFFCNGSGEEEGETMYPVSIGFKQARGRIESLLKNGHHAEALVTSMFINRDAGIARRLMEGKVTIRRKERASVERHMERSARRYAADDIAAHGCIAGSQAH